MYSAIPLSLRAGQGAAVNLLWATPPAAAPSAVIDGSLRAACSSSSLSIPGSLSVGLHTLSLSSGGKELASTLIEVQPSPLPPGGAQTFTAFFPADGAVEWSGETGPRGETGNPGPTGDPGRDGTDGTDGRDGVPPLDQQLSAIYPYLPATSRTVDTTHETFEMYDCWSYATISKPPAGTLTKLRVQLDTLDETTFEDVEAYFLLWEVGSDGSQTRLGASDRIFFDGVEGVDGCGSPATHCAAVFPTPIALSGKKLIIGVASDPRVLTPSECGGWWSYCAGFVSDFYSCENGSGVYSYVDRTNTTLWFRLTLENTSDGKDGAAGAKGDTGPKGPRGKNGTNGTDGKDGTAGEGSTLLAHDPEALNDILYVIAACTYPLNEPSLP